MAELIGMTWCVWKNGSNRSSKVTKTLHVITRGTIQMFSLYSLICRDAELGVGIVVKEN